MLHDLRLHQKKMARHKRAEHVLSGGKGKDAKEAVSAHESHMHPGKPKTFACGGAASGGKSAMRLDKAGRYAKGGGVKKGGKGVSVNIIVNPDTSAASSPAGVAPRGIVPPLPRSVPGGPPLPPVAGGPPPMMAGPGGPPPMMPPRPMKKGGAVKYTAGAATGEGREQKADNYGPVRNKRKSA